MNCPPTSRDSPETPSAPGSGESGNAGIVRLHTDPINILIVDDEPKNLTVLETILDDPGYRLVRAASADQALLMLVAKEFALLILDVRMPGMTGFELATLIRQRKKTEQVPIIFLTAYYNEDQHILEGYGTGAVDYLHKPVNPIILRSKVAVFADLYRKSRAVEFANRALVAEVTERREAQSKLRELNETLERRVEERTATLLEQGKLEQAQREQLRASEEFNRSLMEGTADSVQVLDAQGHVLHANGPSRIQMEIADVARLHGKDWCSLWPEESRDELRRAVEKARRGEITLLTSLRTSVKGLRTWWSVSLSPIHTSYDGQVLRVLAVSRDVTEAREREQALRESDRQKDNFIATLAHELRNPLAPVRNALTLMRRKDAQAAQLTWCRDVIDRQVGQMSRLLEDLLDVSRITRSKLTLQCEQLELAAVIEQAIEVARPSIDEASHSFTVDLPATPIIVYGDSTRLAQVISNLLINAAKYTPTSGKISLGAQVEQGDVLLSVKDTGIGIAPEHLSRVFDMFSQVPASKARTQGGLGIGLALSRGLIELHGGVLSARSAGPDKGSEFLVRLPLRSGPVATPEVTEHADSICVAAEKRRILVVDDLRDNADSLGMVLQSMGHEVQVAYDGEQALVTAAEFRPHVALIDLGMPNVDGYEVCRRIRACTWGSAILLIAQTGWGQEFDRRRTAEAGFDHHLVKPLRWDVVESLLLKRRSADQGPAS
jgi:PAS domain S-box-containing protein